MRSIVFTASLLLLLPAVLALPAPAPVPEVATGGFAITPLAPAAVPTAIEFGPGESGPDLYAALLSGEIVRYHLEWTGAGPVVTGTTVAHDGFSQPLGIAFRGDTLFVSDSHVGDESDRIDGRVWRVEPDGTRTVIVDGLPQGLHNVNHIRFAPDGRLAMANGNANDNGIDQGPPDVFPYSGAVLLVDVDEVAQSPAVLHYDDAAGDDIPLDEIATHPVNDDFNAKVEVLGWGFRNIFGVAFDPDGAAWTGMNGGQSPPTQDLLYKITPGAFHGYPMCHNQGTSGGTDATVHTSPLYPGFDCSGVPPADALLGYHVCATGIDFPTAGGWAFPGEYRRSVYVGECGFFDTQRVGPEFTTHDTGHKVVRVELDENNEVVAVHDFVTGLGLPTDVRFGPDGAMYVADAGMIHRVAPVANAVPGPSAPAEVHVAASGSQFISPVVVVPKGTTIVWDGILLPHTVTTSDTLLDARAGVANDPANNDDDPDTFNRPLAMLGSVRHTFAWPGEYPYYCVFHYRSGMFGEVVVVD